MAAARKEVEPLVLIKTDWQRGLVFPATLASAILPHLRLVNAEYGKQPEFIADKALEFTILTRDQVTAMLVAEQIVKE